MRHQEQPKKEYKLMLVLLFLALFIFIPGLLLVLGHRQWSYSYFIQDNWYNLTIILYLALALFVSWQFCSLMLSDKNDTLRLNLLNDILKNRSDHHGLDVETSGYSYWITRVFRRSYWTNLWRAINGKSNIHHEMIRAIENAIKNASNQYLHRIIDDTAKVTFEKSIHESIIECVRNATISKNEDGNECNISFKEALQEQVNKAFSDIHIQDELLSAITSTNIQDLIHQTIQQALPKNVEINQEMIVRVFKDINLASIRNQSELDAQKYRFVERVVSEICKNNKPNACDIAQIRAMIGDVFGTNHMCQCWDITEEDNKVIFTIHDINCKNLIITYYRDNKAIDFSSTDGEYTLCNGVVITIKDGNIADIKKP